jgi:hypothetical protein
MDARCSRRRTSRIPSPRSHRTSLLQKFIHFLIKWMARPLRYLIVADPQPFLPLSPPSCPHRHRFFSKNSVVFYERRGRKQVTVGYKAKYATHDQEGTAVAKRKIIVHIATSADGYIARPDGNVDWLTNRPAPKRFLRFAKIHAHGRREDSRSKDIRPECQDGRELQRK